MELNHVIVWASDPGRSARFLADLFGRAAPVRSGPFEVISLDNGVSLAFMRQAGPIGAQHYAFLIAESAFDALMARMRDRSVSYWADPYHRQPGAINRNDGGRGVYFEDPDGHDLEAITRPYGGGA